ncbi:PRC-barrel domain containing protein [Palleronia sediminis]|uniref:PRC-barrel domain containing protein n=1 Tax=Palleronia sediminis TaxID=2547833 RepID=A0A4R6AK56_9RHOB|nr:PRC-barrel domain-containing protein [Palleronia sediminis]TDL83672.1 PRC-barrel domain containing protein [Palleronia sediminis]
MDHSKHVPLQPEEMTASMVEGANVYGPEDNHIGDVSELHGTGPTSKVIVDVGGFLGIGAKPVALDVSRLNFMRDENGKVHATTMMTKDELKSLPEHPKS